MTVGETFVRRGVMSAVLALCGAVVIGCTSPPSSVNAGVTFPVRHSVLPTAPAPSASYNPATFRADPGLELTASGGLVPVGNGGPPATFECCVGHDWTSRAADPQTWSPGEQVQITWVKTAPATASTEDTMVLSATMYGPFSSVADAQNLFSETNPVAAAAVVHWQTDFVGSATSVITIPRDAAPGYYELQFNAAAQEAGACGSAACAPGFYEAAIIQVR